MRNWTSRQSEVMYETDRVVILFLQVKMMEKDMRIIQNLYIRNSQG